MGKASRLRREKQERERRQQRGASAPGAAFGFGTPSGFGTGAERASGDSERAAAAVSAAMAAVCAEDQGTYAELLTELASERTLAWTRAVSRSLVRALRTSVTRAWRAGWQPAELTRHVGRELSQQHVSVAADMIAAEMNAYPAAAVDQRWAAQVAAAATLSAGAGGTWWGSDADYLPAWARQARAVGGLRDAIATAVEVLHLLQHLVVLEQLLPLPGTVQATTGSAATGSAGSAAAGQGDERMLARIRALLAKAEGTEFAEEAEALSARAQELMAKYSIDQALLAADEGRADRPDGRRIAVDNPYEGPKTSLLQAVATANRSRVIWSKEVGLATVVGFAADLDAVEVLFTSLLVQADSAMLRAGSRQDAHGRSRTRAFRQSFLVSYAVRIGERLAEAADHATREAAAEHESQAGSTVGHSPAGNGDARQGRREAGTALVPFLAARRRAVDDAVEEMFGGTLRRGRSVRATDAEGWASGRAAADLAALHGRATVTS